MSNWFITYARPLPAPGEMVVGARPTGECEMILTGEPVGVSFQRPGEIGVYVHKFDPSRVEALRDLGQKAVRESLHEEEPVLPGTPLLVFGIGENEDVDPLVSVALSEPLTPMTKQFDDAVQTLMVELLKHPLRTVRGDAVWQGVPVSPQDEVRLHLTLTNSGVAPIEVRNPAAGKDEDQIGLRLQLEKDLPIAKMGPADRIFIKAGRKEVSQISAPGAAPGAKPKRTVRLEPGEELKIEFVVMQHLFLSPGRYRAIIAYESDAAGIAEVRAVEGVLRVQTQILVVAEKAR